MNNIADGFLGALEADFENIAPSAFSDGRAENQPRADLANIKDWSTLKQLSQDFPQIPPSDYQIAKPSSRQRARTAEKNASYVDSIRQLPDEYVHYNDHDQEYDYENDGDNYEYEHNSANASISTTSTSKRRNAKLRQQQIVGKKGWVYSQGWEKRPRVGANLISVVKITQQSQQKAKILANKRATAPYQIGKKTATSFGKLPAVERARPPNYASDEVGEDVARLRYILVDLSYPRTPGPRYVLDPVLNKRNNIINGKRKVHGRSLVTGFSKSITGKSREYPSINDYSGSRAGSSMLDLHTNQSQFNSNSYAMSMDGGVGVGSSSPGGMSSVLPNSDLESRSSGLMWAGRPTSGGIYENAMNSKGPGPAYSVNNAFLNTSTVKNSSRAVFSPIGSKPGSPLPSQSDACKPGLRKRSPSRLSPELSIAHKYHA